ncbi:MAG: hypothetical protein ACP6IS_07845 [Candidatus Asgardarchaeia archaeon]
MKENSSSSESNRINKTENRNKMTYLSSTYTYKLSIVGFDEFINIKTFEHIISIPKSLLYPGLIYSFHLEDIPYWRITIKDSIVERIVRYLIRFQVWFLKVTRYNYEAFEQLLVGSKGIAIMLDMQKDISVQKVIDFIRSRPIKPFSPVLIIVFDKRNNEEMNKALEFRAKFKEDWKNWRKISK